MDLYKKYLVIGGMPEAVLQYTKTSDYNFVLST
jgi:predicted AAA+ superfamily ATPase